MFCCHCRRPSYLSGIRFLQRCPVTHSSLNKAHECRSRSQEEIKLEEEAISEIMVADTDLESVAEANDFEDYFVEEAEEEEDEEVEDDDSDDDDEEEDDNDTSSSGKPHHKLNHRLQQVEDYQPGDCLKEGAQIFIHLSVQRKV